MGVYIYLKKGKGGKGECLTSIKLDELDNFVEQVSDNTHTPSATKLETTKVEANIKRRACGNSVSPIEKYRSQCKSTECL